MAQNTTQASSNLRVVAPDYVYHYPCFRRVKLAAVKQHIPHPDMPSLRHQERDELLHKLPDEHCRTTTACRPRDFALSSMNVLLQPSKKLHCLGCTETGRELYKKFMSPLDVQRQGLIWQHYLENPMVDEILRTKERPLVEPQPDRNCRCTGNVQFDGVPLRYINSGQRTWRYKFRCEPRLLGRAQQPVPSDVVFPRELKPHTASVSCRQK